MRRILPLAITFAALSLSTTGVRADGTWCAHYGTGLEGMNCGFYSFEQCRATVSGVGGFCQANLSSAYAAARQPRRRSGLIGNVDIRLRLIDVRRVGIRSRLHWTQMG